MTVEYPFYARWYVNRALATDIISVDYVVEEYNLSTDAFDDIQIGTINAQDDKGRWIVPFDIPDEIGFKKYSITYTPNGGSHVILSEEIEAFDGNLAGDSTLEGSGTETHSGKVCDPDGNPLQGVTVKAIAYGTINTIASDVTDANGDYSLSGLVANHAYEITFNKDGYFGKRSEVVEV